MIEKAEEFVKKPLILFTVILNILLRLVLTEVDVVVVGPGDVEEEEEGEVDDVTEDEGDEGREKDQPGQELARVSSHNIQLRTEKLVLKHQHCRVKLCRLV